jgi:hypothetical protein
MANDVQGWDELTAMLLEVQVDLVVLEATGGYERGLLCAAVRRRVRGAGQSASGAGL